MECRKEDIFIGKRQSISSSCKGDRAHFGKRGAMKWLKSLLNIALDPIPTVKPVGYVGSHSCA